MPVQTLNDEQRSRLNNMIKKLKLMRDAKIFPVGMNKLITELEGIEKGRFAAYNSQEGLEKAIENIQQEFNRQIVLLGPQLQRKDRSNEFTEESWHNAQALVNRAGDNGKYQRIVGVVINELNVVAGKDMPMPGLIPSNVTAATLASNASKRERVNAVPTDSAKRSNTRASSVGANSPTIYAQTTTKVNELYKRMDAALDKIIIGVAEAQFSKEQFNNLYKVMSTNFEKAKPMFARNNIDITTVQDKLVELRRHYLEITRPTREPPQGPVQPGGPPPILPRRR